MLQTSPRPERCHGRRRSYYRAINESPRAEARVGSLRMQLNKCATQRAKVLALRNLIYTLVLERWCGGFQGAEPVTLPAKQCPRARFVRMAVRISVIGENSESETRTWSASRNACVRASWLPESTAKLCVYF